MATTIELAAIDRLRAWLGKNRATLESNKEELVDQLAGVWDYFADSHAAGMSADKLSRLEAPEWNPPLLSFQIERHGGIVVGRSSRAELQTWRANFETRTTSYAITGWRQISPPQPRLDVKAIAHEIARAVATGDRTDSRVVWTDNQVRIVLGKIAGLATGSAVRETLMGRRKRFRAALRAEMTKVGFKNRITSRGSQSTYIFISTETTTSNSEI